jgi:hypothetical protein
MFDKSPKILQNVLRNNASTQGVEVLYVAANGSVAPEYLLVDFT